MNRKGLRIAVSLFVTSFFLFSILLIFMNFIIIDEEFEIIGEIKEIDGRFELTFCEFENSFYGYEVNDVMEISPIGSNITYEGIVLQRQIKQEIQLKGGLVYEYVVNIDDGDKLDVKNIGTNFRIPSKQQRTMIDLLLSEIIR